TGTGLVGPWFTPMAVVGSTIGTMCFAFSLRGIETQLNARWKKGTGRRLGLTGKMLYEFVHVALIESWGVPESRNVGLLELDRDGLIFHSTDGAWTVSLDDVQSVSVEGFVGYFWLRVNLCERS